MKIEKRHIITGGKVPGITPQMNSTKFAAIEMMQQ